MNDSRFRLVSTIAAVEAGDATSELAVELRGLSLVGLHILLRFDLKGEKRRQKYVGLGDGDDASPEVSEVGEELLQRGVVGVLDCVVVKMVLVERPLLRIRTAWHDRCLL